MQHKADPSALSSIFSIPSLYVDGCLVIGNGTPILRLVFWEQFVNPNGTEMRPRVAISMLDTNARALINALETFLNDTASSQPIRRQ
jgi:hypothetical protein